MRIILLLLLALISSCKYVDTRMKNPKPNDLEGRWESLSILQYLPYALLEVNSEGEGTLIVVDEEITEKFLTFEFSKSLDREFIVNVTFIYMNGDESEPESIMGSINRGQLCFYVPEEEKQESANTSDYLACFTKFEKVQSFRKRALEYLRKIK